MENLNNNPITYEKAAVTVPTQIKDFLNSNNFVAKVSFLFLIIFVVVVFFQIIMRYLFYLYSPPASVKLVDGMISAGSMKMIAQDITQSPNMLVTHSTNKEGGIEFTWSVWVFIKSLSTSNRIFHNVFFKGNYNPYSGVSRNCQGLNIPNNAPGLYIVNDSSTRSASLQVLMDTFQQASSFVNGTECSVPNPLSVPHIPLDTWVNVVIRCTGNILDCYVNGVIANSVSLVGVPKQNYGNIYVAADGGFDGNISSLIYMKHAASNKEIWQIFQKGPNTKSIDADLNNFSKANFLSFNWYLVN
jgi:hypothetical protein